MLNQSHNIEKNRKTYLIIGASSGIGKATAQRMATPDNHLILAARRKELIDDYSSSLKCEVTSIMCDVKDPNSIELLFKYLRENDIKLTGVLYSAGILDVKPIKYMENGEIERMFQVNTFGFYNICRYLYDFMDKDSSIVAMSSYAAVTKERGMSAYSASKAALNTIVEILSKEFIKRSIRVNAVMPGKTTSRMGSDVDEWSKEELPDRMKGQQLGLIPVSEVVDVIESLLTPCYNHFTGELITISGGYQPGQ